ncbi:hypothetical protein BpHYR1_021130 [Brachionus plicatilis]|uniref:Uncharacterized protein n=1 Tax=Brachionus plicatilis TaxID=10195 RepID=A0A3M7QY47_BRAPC|nr:hypothetical protein BpHYR1_021130 [Brachionus plicatilis]
MGGRNARCCCVPAGPRCPPGCMPIGGGMGGFGQGMGLGMGMGQGMGGFGQGLGGYGAMGGFGHGMSMGHGMGGFGQGMGQQVHLICQPVQQQQHFQPQFPLPAPIPYPPMPGPTPIPYPPMPLPTPLPHPPINPQIQNPVPQQIVVYRPSSSSAARVQCPPGCVPAKSFSSNSSPSPRHRQ